MRALRFEKFGPPGEVLRIGEIERPVPGPGEVLVQVHAAGINPSDVINVGGKFSHTKLPRTPGRDLAGIVVEGDQQWIGREVVASGGNLAFDRDGGHAEYILLKTTDLAPKSSKLTMAQAATLGVPFTTAWLAVRERLNVQKGETLLVTGSSGAVGSAASQLAMALGVEVIGIDVVDAHIKGMKAVLQAKDEDVFQQARALTKGQGANAYFDVIGGTLGKAIAAIAVSGRMAVIAAPPEGSIDFPLRDFYRNNLTLHGIDSAKITTEQAAVILTSVNALFDAGSLQPPTVVSRPFAEAIQAYEDLAAKRAGGKIALVMVGE